VIIDSQNRVWVSNSQADTLLRFPADDPTKVETFHAGLSVRALALDEKGNLWVTSLASPDFPVPKMPPGASTNGRSVVLLAGDESKGHPTSTRTGDLVHVFTGGSIQIITDVAIDPAGNVWVANNWDSIAGATADNPPYPVSTWGGGSGLTVIYGVAGPVKPPRSGNVRTH
jgi:ligand-binding sensor domain-containing protein